MDSLESIYYESNSSNCNKLCEGCSILGKEKPVHSYIDHHSLSECEVLFVSDSFQYRYGKLTAFSKKGLSLLKEVFPGDKFAVTASVKCPSIKDKELSTQDMKICRTHIESTIDKVKPKLVYACGNLAMRMLLKKSGITNKRGSAFAMTTPEGTECVVVPIYHPFAVVREPKNRYLFETDIKNGYSKYILGNTSLGNFSYHTVMEVEELLDLTEMLTNGYKETIAVDIETTGLNFLTDELQTIAISTPDMNWVIPCDHKESPFGHGSKDRDLLWKCLDKILTNPDNRKVFHNAKFDLKFLITKGIIVTNVHDTKIMHHLFDENVPKGLKDLVKIYFPIELETL